MQLYMHAKYTTGCAKNLAPVKYSLLNNLHKLPKLNQNNFE